MIQSYVNKSCDTVVRQVNIFCFNVFFLLDMQLFTAMSHYANFFPDQYFSLLVQYVHVTTYPDVWLGEYFVPKFMQLIEE